MQSQDLKYYSYDTDLLKPEFHTERREVVRKELPDSSMAVFFTSPERNRSNDVDYSYHQEPDFYYLTGFTEANSVLVIFKEPQVISGMKTNEIIFAPERVPRKELWTGRMAGPEGAAKISGIRTAMASTSFDTLSIPYSRFRQVLYLRLPKGIADDKSNPVDLSELVASFKKNSGYPASNGDDFLLGKILAAMREVKTTDEITMLRKAISISSTGHREMMKAAKPGSTEFQVQAVGEYFFKKEGAESVGYPSICGSAENSCILHYESNRKKLNSADLLLLDMGAEYHGYSADVTRTIPVNGKFSNEQKAIYELVYNAQEVAFKACKPGNNFKDPHDAAFGVIQEGLLALGIINDKTETSKYFMHGTSHYLGLDVHDVGKYGPLKPGNVITVEPGIYIPEGSPCDRKWWNIGIRIEDDILITDTGFENLSIGAPRKWEEIEVIMAEKSFFKN